jgi:hypothetical protein
MRVPSVMTPILATIAALIGLAAPAPAHQRQLL